MRSSPAIGADGTIYVGVEDNYVIAINPDTTRVKWFFATGGNVVSSPAIATDGTIYIGCDDGFLYAINPDGSQKWAFATGGAVDSSPAIGADGTIYVGDVDAHLYAVGGAPSNNPTATATNTPTTASLSTPTNTPIQTATSTSPQTSTNTPTATPTSTLTPPPGSIPGQGNSACMLEWFTEPGPLINSHALPLHQLACTDDNPLCDFGAATGDNACTFHVALCLNVADTRLPCAPTNLARVRVLSPSEANPNNATATANRDALETALTALGGIVRGQCANKAHRGQLCEVNADCDSSPGSGGGVCSGRLVAFAPPYSAHNTCTAFAPIQVPLRNTLTGSKGASVRLRVKATSDPSVAKREHNSLTLICKPHS